MGLFGYGKSDFDKNTGSMKSRLERLVNDVYEMGSDATNVGKTITKLILKLESVGFTKGGKDAEAVDAYINKVIGDMEQDAMKGNTPALIARADNLYNEINQSRRFGKNAFTNDERQAEDVRATALGNINNSLNKLAEIEKKKEQLLNAGAKTESPAERQRLGLLYNSLVAEEKSTNQAVQMWTTRYNSAIQVINARRTSGQIQELTTAQVVDVRSFQKEMDRANQLLQREMEKDNEITNIANEFGNAFDETLGGVSSQSSGWDALVEDKKRENLMNEFGAAPAGGSTVQESDPFSQALNNFNK